MFGSVMLEVAIGAVFVFLLVSVVAMAVREWIEGWLKTRAAFLEQGIREMLHDKDAVGVARSFYTHPLINSLYSAAYVPRVTQGRPSSWSSGKGLPSYIPARNFALTLLDIAARGADGRASGDGQTPMLNLATVRSNIVNIENASVQRVLLTAIDTAQGDLERAIANIGAWYDSGMDRVSGAYKRSTQQMLFLIGLAVAIGLNVNTVAVADFLYRNDAAREVVVARAEAVARDTGFIRHDSANKFVTARQQLDSLRLPLGWVGMEFHAPGFEKVVTTDDNGVQHSVVIHRSWWDYVWSPFLGWLLTGLAATFGAPFWFDVLNKMMVIRSTVKPHEKSPEESSEDRQNNSSRGKGGSNSAASTSPPDSTAVMPPTNPATAPATAPNPAPVVASNPAPNPQQNPVNAATDDVDGCDAHGAGSPTPDDELPAARGGVS